MMSGCTCASDHHYLFGRPRGGDGRPGRGGRLGLRITLTRGAMNLSGEGGGRSPDAGVQDADVILADCERVISRYHERRRAMLQVALAPSHRSR